MNKKVLSGIGIALIAFFIFVFSLKESFIFHSDFARDIYGILKISQGNLTLLGPKVSFGGLYTAPYYFYLFVPAYILSGLNISGILYFNALLSAAAIFYFFYKAAEKFPLWKATVVSFVLALMPLYLFSARSPSVSTSGLPLLLIFLTYVYFNKIDKPLIILILGFFFGVVINFGFLHFLILIPVFILILSKLKKKIHSLYFLLGIGVAFIPLILFELKNNFIMIKNTFIDKSYLSWIQNENVLRGKSGRKNIFENILFMSEQLKFLMVVSPLIMLSALSFILYFEKKLRKNRFLILNSLFALVILSALIRFQFAVHYLYPTAFFIFFVILLLLLTSRYIWPLFLLLVLEIIFFPKQIYSKSNITAEPFELAVKYSIDNKLVDKNSNFNVVMIAHPNAIVGFEYRYFLQKNGFNPLSEFEYNKSDTLLIYTRRKNLDPSTLDTWEIQQFGKNNLLKTSKYQTGEIYIFKATRQK